jgi:hypothetical protein
VSVDVENRLTPGRYFLHHGVGRTRSGNYLAVWVPHALGFVVFGDQHSIGIVAPEHQMKVRKEDEPQ